MRLRFLALVLAAAIPSAVSQTANLQPAKPAPAAATARTVVPALVTYSGVALTADGRPLTGDIGVTFLIFKDEQGGEPLWTETQTVAVDADAHYRVELGAASSSGLPIETFSSGEARWLEIQIAGQSPQPRVLLSSVPYALKAADAATLGGLPASAFALAGAKNIPTALEAGPIPDAASTVTTTGGTLNYLPVFSGASTIVNSEIVDTGTAVGIGDVPNPAAKLDINGEVIMRGSMQVSRSGNATASKGYPSYPFEFYSNVYNSSLKITQNPFFELESEPVGNDTATPSSTFNLLYVNGETGFYINPHGQIHFAPGQTFPGTGTGNGTITGVTAGTGLSGGGTSGNVTLNVDTTQVPLLATANNFTGNQTVNGNVGIGTTAPNAPLDIETPNVGQALLVEANGNDSWALNIFGGSNGGLAGRFISGDGGDGIQVGGGDGYYSGTGGLAGYFAGGDANATGGKGGDGIDASAGLGAAAAGWAGYFSGDVGVTGTVFADNASVRIDHPLDPADKYLQHASTESSERMTSTPGTSPRTRAESLL